MNGGQTLTIFEYDKIFVQQRRNLEKNIISERDASYLQNVVIDNSPIFSLGNHCLIAQQWVGVVSLPEFSIEILPKIFSSSQSSNIRDILVRMLLVAHLSTNIRQIPAKLSLRNNSLLEMLIETFLIKLQGYVDSGLQREYKKVICNLNKVKGKIVFAKQICKNNLNMTRFFCKYSCFQEDSELNQFFKACLMYLENVTTDLKNKTRIEALLYNFYQVTSISPEAAIKLNARFTPINFQAEEIYRYGKMLLSNCYVSFYGGLTNIYSMFFDMNRLFETFIYRSAVFVYGKKVTYQRKIGYAVLRNIDGKKFISMRPDLTITTNDGKRVIVDTKWKIPFKFAKERDVYQLYAYASKSNKTDKVVLLYPYIGSTEKLIGSYSFLMEDGSNKTLDIKTIDLSKIINWHPFLKELEFVLNC